MRSENFTNNSDFSTSIELSPKLLIVRVLEACNAGCFMCDFAWSKDTYRFSHNDAVSLVEQIRGSEIKVIRLTGGEPLILSDIAEILSILKQEELLTSIITNGFYLPEKIRALSTGLLDHIILSIDGSTAEKHDGFRRLPGLYKNICKGIRLLQKQSANTVVRVNTIVGIHNIKDLKQIYDNLCTLGVNQWSIIPLKQRDSTWRGLSFTQLSYEFESFKRHVIENPSSLKLLGHSLNWAGHTLEEVRKSWEEGRSMTPKRECFLVDKVRYYIPKDGIVFPCNCVPHRKNDIELSTEWSTDAVLTTGLKDSRTWLKQFGPSLCMGCEPINAALGEGAIDLDSEPLSF